jgi:hypothetical protein
MPRLMPGSNVGLILSTEHHGGIMSETNAPEPTEPGAQAPDPVVTDPAATDAEPVETAPADAPVETLPADGSTPAGAPSTGSVTGVSNQSPQLPANAQAAAAKAHAGLGHLIQVAQRIQGELERFIPAGLIQSAEAEVKGLVREIL